jgi:dTDP-glucose 4,6-dehydratase
MPFSNQRAVVTGGAGFLGSHVREQLLDAGAYVCCLDNFLTGAPANVAHLQSHSRFRLVRCDLTDFVHVPGRSTSYCTWPRRLHPRTTSSCRSRR